MSWFKTTLYCCLGMLTLTGGTHSEEPSEPAQSAEAADPSGGVEERAVVLMRQMASHLGRQQAFRFSSEDLYDATLETGQKVQLTKRRTVSIQRPDKLRAEIQGDLADRQIWYDGKTLTLLNPRENAYGVLEAGGTIDAMLDYVMEQFALTLPIADFMVSDPYHALMADVKTGTYLGLRFVGSVACHHLAFTQDNLDWQIWIQAEEPPLPRKLVLTYKLDPGQPQYITIINEWELSPKFSPEVFTFTAPEGAEQIEVLPARSAEPSSAEEPSAEEKPE